MGCYKVGTLEESYQGKEPFILSSLRGLTPKGLSTGTKRAHTEVLINTLVHWDGNKENI